MVQDLGVLKLKSGPNSKLKSGPNIVTVFPHFYSVLWAFLESQIVQQCVKIVFLQNLGDVKNEVFEKKKLHFLFFLFYAGKIEKMEKAQKTP